MKHRMVIMVLALFTVSGVIAFAQTANVEIGFPFMARDKDFPAGKYTVEVAQDTRSMVLRGASGSVIMLVVTRLGRHDNDTDAELVFDKIGDKALLSEAWFPGQDGYLVLTTKEAHKHAVAGGSNPRK